MERSEQDGKKDKTKMKKAKNTVSAMNGMKIWQNNTNWKGAFFGSGRSTAHNL